MGLLHSNNTAGHPSMKGFHVLGVTQVNDSYPNVKYKLRALQRLLGESYAEYVVPLDESRGSSGLFSAMRSGRLMFGLRFTGGHIKVMLRTLRNSAKYAYVCYPGIFIAVWLSLPFICRRYPVVYLDAFISLYDTIVFDRGILREGSLLSRILYRLEKRAFTAATAVVVDTPENAQYYSQLFDLPEDKFYAMPLCIPPMLPTESPPYRTGSRPLRCVFVGTFVPLQGIRTIVAAVELLSDDSEIEFVFVGDGQDAHYLQDYVANTENAKIIWHQGHFPTQFIIDEIRSADICLGIFGDGPKTQRVLPYKIYYYLALGMPIVTAATDTTRRIHADCEDSQHSVPMQLVPVGDPEALAMKLRSLKENPAKSARVANAAADYYRRVLSDPAIGISLQEMIDSA